MSCNRFSGSRARLSLSLSICLGLASVSVLGSPEAPDESSTNVADDVLEQHVEVTTTEPLPPHETSVSGRDLDESNVDDLAASLRNQPGLDATRRGPINLDPQVRGIAEAQLAVTVDGTRTFAAGPGRMDSGLSHVNPHTVHRLRVVKGPHALTWGAGAFAAIQVETFQSDPSPEGFEYGGRVRGAYTANRDSTDAFADAWFSTEKLAFQLFHGDRRGSDYESGDGTTVPAHFDSRETHWSLSYQPTGALQWRYTGGVQRQEDIEYAGRPLDAGYFGALSHDLQLDWQGTSSEALRLTAQVYVNNKDHRMNNDGKPSAQPNPERPFGIEVDFPTQSDTRGARTMLSWSTNRVDLAMGADYFHLEQSARRKMYRRDTGMLMFDDIAWPETRVDHGGLFGRATFTPGPWEIAGTLRLDGERSRPGPVSEYFRDNTRGDLDRDDLDWSASVSAHRHLADRWDVTLGLGRVVRMPTALERYSDRFPSSKLQISAEVLGDPTLAPEVGYQLDAGAGVEAGRLSARADLYYREVDHYITVTHDPDLSPRLPMSPDTVFRYENGGRARFLGGEVLLSYQFHPQWSGHADLSYLRGDELDRNEPTVGVPPLTGRVGLRWSLPSHRAWLEATGTHRARQDRVATSRFEQPTDGYTIADLRGGIRLGSAWEVQAGVENLGDAEYTTHLNAVNPFTKERVPEPGRQAYLALELRF